MPKHVLNNRGRAFYHPIPYPIASVVEYEGLKYIVESFALPHRYKQANDVEYSLTGAVEYGSEGMGCAWESHDELVLLEMPSSKSWAAMCKGAMYDEDFDEREQGFEVDDDMEDDECMDIT